MKLFMLGIDHNSGTIEERSIFSFTKKAAADFLLKFKENEGISGCVLISTCNRMELYISCNEEYEGSPYRSLCEYKGINPEDYKDNFKKISDYRVVRHLFYLAGGIKSKILGEDQILTQVKEALNFSRDLDCTDKMLEVLFRMAVTAGKKIKTEYRLSYANKSIIHQVIYELKKKGYDFQDKKCMVIGNGEMGKLAATMLKEEGARVLVTVRQYKSGVVIIPEGCERINYGERLEYLPEQDLILSATASPNTTLKFEDVRELHFTSPKMMIDLALPRDIDPEIGNLPGTTLYDLDSFHVDVQSEEMKEQLKEIERVLNHKISEFISWYQCKDMIPTVQKISEKAADDVHLRIQKTVKKLSLPGDDKKNLERTIEMATAKVIKKLMFGIRDEVSPGTFQECVEAVSKLYEKAEQIPFPEQSDEGLTSSSM